MHTHSILESLDLDKEDRGGSVVNKTQLADRTRVWAGRRVTFSSLLALYSPLCVFWCYFAIVA